VRSVTHVSELRDRIDARMGVTTLQRGSRARFIVR